LTIAPTTFGCVYAQIQNHGKDYTITSTIRKSIPKGVYWNYNIWIKEDDGLADVQYTFCPNKKEIQWRNFYRDIVNDILIFDDKTHKFSTKEKI
jgi:hypothetical protein